MDATIANQAHKMGCAATSFERVDEGNQRIACLEAAVLQSLIDLHQVHLYDPTRADIRMPNLGIAHLPFRQSHVPAVRQKRRVGTTGHQRVHRGRFGERRRVVGGVRV